MKATLNPTPKQWNTLEHLLYKTGKNHILYGGAAGGGKTYLGCAWLLMSAINYPGSRWMMGRSELSALRSSTLATFLDLARQWECNNLFKLNLQANEIRFTNGSVIMMKDLQQKPSDPDFDSLGSIEVSGAFIDEAAQITEKCYQVVSSRIRYKLDEFDIEPKLLMTCNPSKNWLYTLFYKPTMEGNMAEYRYFIQAKVSDNKNISQDYIIALDRLTPRLRARLMDGDWDYDNDPTQLIQADKIENIFSNINYFNGTHYLTGDIARMGSDKTVLYVWNGFTIIDVMIYGKTDLVTTADNIRRLQQTYSIQNTNTIVDEDGVGGGVVDMLKCKGITNNLKALNGENYVNLKTQLYYKLVDKINTNGISITEKVWRNENFRPHLTQELSYVRSVSNDNKLDLMKKDKIKSFIGRSPDYSDALAYRMLTDIDRGKVTVLPQEDRIQKRLEKTLWRK